MNTDGENVIDLEKAIISIAYWNVGGTVWQGIDISLVHRFAKLYAETRVDFFFCSPFPFLFSPVFYLSLFF